MKTTLRILLADDHQMFRDALRSLLEVAHCTKSFCLEVVAETGDGLEVVNLARSSLPDIVCMDIGMPGMNGIEATRRLLAACPGVKVIAVSAFTEQHYVLDMLDAGAMAYVTKAGASDELLRAIEAVRSDKKYLCPLIANVVANALSGLGVVKSKSPGQLGARERQVLQMVAEGVPTAKSAYALSLKYKIDMPIIREVYYLLYKNKSPRQAVKDLMTRKSKEE